MDKDKDKRRAREFEGMVLGLGLAWCARACAWACDLNWVCDLCCLFGHGYLAEEEGDGGRKATRKKRMKRRKKKAGSQQPQPQPQDEGPAAQGDGKCEGEGTPVAVAVQLTEEEVIVRSFVSVMSEGITFSMILADGRSKEVRLFVDETQIVWKNVAPPHAGGRLDIKDVTSAVDGYPMWMEGKVEQEEVCCFTLETRGKGTLVFAALSAVEREAMVEGFSLLLIHLSNATTLQQSVNI